jgi:hypothetical protein
MPEAHKAVAEWSSERFISWAAKTGEKAQAYIAAILASRDCPEQSYKTCAGILRLAKTTPDAIMEITCAEALDRKLFTYRAFSALLSNRKEAEAAKPIRHENIRGSGYFAEEANHAE